jgi:hypothetical protein
MSAGRFVDTRYQAAYGAGSAIHPIRVQPETRNLSINSAANEAPTADISNPISAVISRGVRARGLRPATVTLTWTGTAPATPGNIGSTTVPLLNAAIRAEAASADDDTDVTYLGVSTWRVSGYRQEEAK